MCYILGHNFICTPSVSSLCPFQTLEHKPTGPIGTGYSLMCPIGLVPPILFTSLFWFFLSSQDFTIIPEPRTGISSMLSAEAVAVRNCIACLAMASIAPFKHQREQLLHGHISLRSSELCSGLPQHPGFLQTHPASSRGAGSQRFCTVS